MAAPERFLCDGMLGSVTRWLRLLGFDAAYAGSGTPDGEVLARAEQEGRFLVTMDLALMQRAQKRGVACLLLKAASRDEQLLLLLIHTGAKVEAERFLTRCTECGQRLDVASRESVAEKVPPLVLERQREFWRCPDCAHVYWRGSHATEIEEKTLDLVRKMTQA